MLVPLISLSMNTLEELAAPQPTGRPLAIIKGNSVPHLHFWMWYELYIPCTRLWDYQ